MQRELKIDHQRVNFINNLTKLIEDKIGVESYMITEQDVADKYKVDIEEIIAIEKLAIPIEIDIKLPKVRRAKILKNLMENGLEFYKEQEGLKSDFTDAIIVNKDAQILFLKRNNKTNIEPNKYGLPGGHLELALSPERNVKKEIKEETGLDVMDCSFVFKKTIKANRTIYYFFCSLFPEYEIILNESEHTMYKWFSLKDLKEEPSENFMFDLKDYLIKNLT